MYANYGIMNSNEKSLFWIGSTLKNLRGFPEEVRRVFGYALRLAQFGGKHVDAKPLTGFSGASVLEVVGDHDGNTYRMVYTVKFSGVIYALHAFQKKTQATAKRDIDLAKTRLTELIRGK